MDHAQFVLAIRQSSECVVARVLGVDLKNAPVVDLGASREPRGWAALMDAAGESG